MGEVERLLAALTGDDPVAQRAAALKLGAMRNPLVVPELVRAAATDDETLRAFIASALAGLGNVEHLRPALTSGDLRVRLTGVAALRHLSGDAAARGLALMLADEVALVREAAAAALRAQGTPAAQTALREAGLAE